MQVDIESERARGREPSPGWWTEEELLARMLAREAHAWREFVRRFERLMLGAIDSVIRRFHAVLGSADREDIYANLLYGLQSRDMHRLRAFDSQRGVRLGNWLGLLARNSAWDFLRTRSRHSRGSAWSAELDDLPSKEADILQTLEARETLSRVRSVLPTLSSRDRTFVRLFYVEGLDPQQVSHAMQISVKTVYSKNHKLRTRLLSSTAEAPACRR